MTGKAAPAVYQEYTQVPVHMQVTGEVAYLTNQAYSTLVDLPYLQFNMERSTYLLTIRRIIIIAIKSLYRL